MSGGIGGQLYWNTQLLTDSLQVFIGGARKFGYPVLDLLNAKPGYPAKGS